MNKKITMYVASMLLGCTTLVGSIYAQTNLQSETIKDIEMVPLREVSEKLGFSVQWNGKENTQIFNPFTKHHSLEELKSAVGFEFDILANLPEGYELSSVSDMSNKMVDIRWSKENSQIIYRVAQGDEQDISGDYNKYSDVTSMNIGGTNVVLKGNDNKVYVATWHKDQLVHALTITDGLSKQEIEDLIK